MRKIKNFFGIRKTTVGVVSLMIATGFYTSLDKVDTVNAAINNSEKVVVQSRSLGKSNDDYKNDIDQLQNLPEGLKNDFKHEIDNFWALNQAVYDQAVLYNDNLKPKIDELNTQIYLSDKEKTDLMNNLHYKYGEIWGIAGKNKTKAILTDAKVKNISNGKAVLQGLVEDVQTKESTDSDYTSNTYNKLTEALNNADKVIKSDNVGQDEIANTTQNLRSSFDGLVNLKELNNLIKEAKDKDINKKDYTPETFENLTDALKKAEEVKGNENAVQIDVDTVAGKLKTALDELKNKADFGTLNDLINQAKTKSKKSDDYTPETFEKFTDALGKAKDISANENADQDDVDISTQNLQAAIDDLVNLKELNNLIKEAKDKDINKKNYTSETFNRLTEALKEAEKISTKKNATQNDVDTVVGKLKTALDGLKNKADFGTLNDLIDQAKSKKSDDYTPETFEKLTDALEKAKEISANENADQDKINATVENLKTMLKGLVKVSENTTKPTNPDQNNNVTDESYEPFEANGIINFVKGYNVFLTDENGNIQSQNLLHGTYWKIVARKMINGELYYCLGNDKQWVPAKYILLDNEVQPLFTVGTVTYQPGYSVLLANADGNVPEPANRQFIKTGTKWKVFAVKAINGNLFYLLGTQEQWIPAKYLNI